MSKPDKALQECFDDVADAFRDLGSNIACALLCAAIEVVSFLRRVIRK